MPTLNNQMPVNNYDSRWFIWAIVFLVVTGVSLVSYVTLSANDNNNLAAVTIPARHTVLPK